MRLFVRAAVAILAVSSLTLAAEAADPKRDKGGKPGAAKKPPAKSNVAFYMCDGEHKGKTAEEAAATCKKASPACSCTKDKAAAVRGPLPVDEATKQGGDKDYNYCDGNGGCYSKTGEPVCFAAGTLVSTPTGAKTIESFQVGDQVYAYDEASGERVIAVVEKVFVHNGTTIGDLMLDDGTALAVTRNHPFFKPETGEWVQAGSLQAGDVLLKEADGLLTSVRVASLSFTRSVEHVYNIEVAEHHNYFAAGVLVHNY